MPITQGSRSSLSTAPGLRIWQPVDWKHRAWTPLPGGRGPLTAGSVLLRRLWNKAREEKSFSRGLSQRIFDIWHWNPPSVRTAEAPGFWGTHRTTRERSYPGTRGCCSSPASHLGTGSSAQGRAAATPPVRTPRPRPQTISREARSRQTCGDSVWNAAFPLCGGRWPQRWSHWPLTPSQASGWPSLPEEGLGLPTHLRWTEWSRSDNCHFRNWFQKDILPFWEPVLLYLLRGSPVERPRRQGAGPAHTHTPASDLGWSRPRHGEMSTALLNTVITGAQWNLSQNPTGKRPADS